MQDSQLVRKADRYLGSAICRVISVARSLRRLGGMSALEPPPKAAKVLLIELFEMGAGVMLQPSVRYLREKDASAEIYCLTSASCAAIWRAQSLIAEDRLFVCDTSSPLKFMISFLRTVWRLRRIRFDVVIDYELFMRVPAILVGLLKARHRAGFHRYQFEGLYRGSFYDRRCAFNQNSHIAKNFLALTRTAYEPSNDEPTFKGALTAENLGTPPIHPIDLTALPVLPSAWPATIFAKKLILISPTVGKVLPMRDYPALSWSAVVRALAERYSDYAFVFIGTAGDSPVAQKIIATVGPAAPRCFNSCGQTSFGQMMKLIAQAELLITNDNGPAHFASLTGTKVLTLFSTDSPFVYGPLGDAVIGYSYFHCSPCISAYNHKVSKCGNNRCLQVLTPDFVVGLAESILNGQARFRTINNVQPYWF